VVENQRREARDVSGLNRKSFGGKLIERCADIQRIPQNDDVYNQTECR
jgi:hypothetical protein